MVTEPSLERLEQDVLSRIRTHRERASNRSALPVGAVVTACALIVGLGVGVASAQHRQSAGASEVVVLGEDASLAPSSLLASGP
ncbi:MAG TPA: hypothetical protein VMD56_10430 [Steroidobacteraceae bacterium]|nr:hypothetical protein [Steroidobacteraceae bacterium]